jgi:Fur family transcriptional regulator, peroxide stress response regulator
MNSLAEFRTLCHRHRLAATHQRQVIYEAVTSLAGHPSPEAIYDKVRKKIPSVSLATVYKNIRTFLDSGLLQEVSLHHGSLRVESNPSPHHHLVCVRCRAIVDFDEAGLGPLQLRKLPRGFKVKRIAVDILGICRACSSGGTRKT